MKLNENPSIGNRVVPCPRTDTETNGQMDGQTDR